MPLKKATNTAKATSSAHLRKQLADATAIIARVETLEAELQPEACSRRRSACFTEFIAFLEWHDTLLC